MSGTLEVQVIVFGPSGIGGIRTPCRVMVRKWALKRLLYHQRGCCIITLGSIYVPCRYMEPWGLCQSR